MENLDIIKSEVLGKLDAIKKGLQEQDPLVDIHCKEIHRTLHQYEELVHMLSDDDIHVMMAAMQKRIEINLTQETKNKASRRKISVDDL